LYEPLSLLPDVVGASLLQELDVTGSQTQPGSFRPSSQTHPISQSSVNESKQQQCSQLSAILSAADAQTTRARSPKEKHEDLMKPSDAVYNDKPKTKT
jgi:hypothetical protein